MRAVVGRWTGLLRNPAPCDHEPPSRENRRVIFDVNGRLPRATRWDLELHIVRWQEEGLRSKYSRRRCSGEAFHFGAQCCAEAVRVTVFPSKIFLEVMSSRKLSKSLEQRQERAIEGILDARRMAGSRLVAVDRGTEAEGLSTDDAGRR